MEEDDVIKLLEKYTYKLEKAGVLDPDMYDMMIMFLFRYDWED